MNEKKRGRELEGKWKDYEGIKEFQLSSDQHLENILL